MRSIGFVCTNYNNARYTQEAVRSLVKAAGGDVIIAVVDNCSVLEDVAILHQIAAQYSQVKLILNKTNVGYFAGLNVGIRHIRRGWPDTSHIVVGNNDLVFPEDFVTSVRGYWQHFENHAVVSPDVVTVDGVHQNPHVISGISGLRQIVYDFYYSNYYLALIIRKIAKHTRPMSNRRDETFWRIPQRIHQGHGSCYILGPLFFANFEQLWAPSFMMGEEFFLSKQLGDKGLGVFYEPGIKVVHHYHATVEQVPAKRMWRMARDAHRIYRRHVKRF